MDLYAVEPIFCSRVPLRAHRSSEPATRRLKGRYLLQRLPGTRPRIAQNPDLPHGLPPHRHVHPKRRIVQRRISNSGDLALPDIEVDEVRPAFDRKGRRIRQKRLCAIGHRALPAQLIESRIPDETPGPTVLGNETIDV